MPRFMLVLLTLALLSLPAAAQEAGTPIVMSPTTMIGPLEYPAGINPLTGLRVDAPEMLQRRPVIVKISNYPPEIRPQSGLSAADIVWEALLAGGVTRFAAIYLSQDVDHVGPIRSARLSDFELAHIYSGFFVYSGMAQGVIDWLYQDEKALALALGGIEPCPALCRFPSEGVALEHTLFGDTAALRDLARERGRDLTPEPLNGMAFQAEAPVNGQPLDAVEIRYSQTTVEWRYDAARGRWLRWQDGEPHFDALTEAQIDAANVVILDALHMEQPVVRDGYWGPANYAFDIPLVAGGRVFLLRDGQMFEGVWRRDSETAPLTFEDATGAALPFKPGNTFINVVPRWVNGYELAFHLSDPLTAVVAGSVGINLRLGPGEGFASPDVSYPGDTFYAIGRDRRGDWIQLLTSGSRLIWVARDLLEIDGDPMRLPFVRSMAE